MHIHVCRVDQLQSALITPTKKVEGEAGGTDLYLLFKLYLLF